MPQPASIPPDARRSLLVYNLLFPLVFLALLPGFARRMFRRGGFRENFGQRLGRYTPETRARFATGRWWWLHSISVGETLVALKLANELHRRDPAVNVVITVTTSTGFALATTARPDWLEILYNPIDARSIVGAALDLIHPERLVLIEGEAWPNLLAACRNRGIPTALVNARLSPRSERRFLCTRYWIAPIFRLIGKICVPETTDIPRWQNLGLSESQLHVTGSIKFDSAGDTPPTRTAEFRELLRTLAVPEDAPILLAGSTWDPEERILAETFLRLRNDFPDLFLILVPRHIERTADILRDLASLPLRICRRTTLPLPTPSPCDLLIVDTTGELREWYPLATLVFIGKSLPGIPEIGGQNPAEPAALGKPIIAGPHLENFAAIATLLHSHRSLVTVPDPAALHDSLRNLLRDPTERTALGERARHALLAHHHATARTATILLPPDR